MKTKSSKFRHLQRCRCLLGRRRRRREPPNPVFWTLLADIHDDRAIPFPQRLLRDALNRPAAHHRKAARALRLGADFAIPCDGHGGLAMMGLARRGRRPFDAESALGWGADLATVDSNSRNFAHAAMHSHNGAMVRWAASKRPALLDGYDRDGRSPFELALGESERSLVLGTEERLAFWDMALALHSPEAAERLRHRAAAAWCAQFSDRDYVDPQAELGWLAGIGALSADVHLDEAALLAQLAAASPNFPEAATSILEAHLARREQSALGLALPSPPTEAARAAPAADPRRL